MSSSVTTLSKQRKTPGVYVTEFPAFPPSIVGVETAIPIFVGYTQKAIDPSSTKQVYMQPIAISSMSDFESYFGFGFDAQGVVETVLPANLQYGYDLEAATSDGVAPAIPGYFIVGTSPSDTSPSSVPLFNLYAAVELFYANGGGNCFVISVASYWGANNVTAAATPPVVTTVSATDLQNGLNIAHDTRGGTMLVVPDACLLTANTVDPFGVKDYTDYGKVVVQMLTQAGTLQDRVAILDMPAALDPASWSAEGMAAEAESFYTAIAPAADYFSYGACYGPALESSRLAVADVYYSNLCGTTNATIYANNLLTTQALSLYPGTEVDDPKNPGTTIFQYSSSFINVAARIAAAFPVTGATALPTNPSPAIGQIANPTATALPAELVVSITNSAVPFTAPTDPAAIKALDQYLLNAVPLLSNLQQVLASKLNVVPPSGIMAGIWTQNDATRGVWNAPANVTLNEVIAPMVVLTDEQQGDYNVPLNGNAIDILRAMINRGTVVWGARTLDGNSLDYRYIQVRRTLIYIEQSIKQALQQFVFAANDGGTWATVTATISNFLTQFWQAGGLMGDKASDAFTVQCGVPTTMSGLDVLNGYMIVNVTVQLIHPAEFIELTFTQTMQGV